MGCCQPVSEYDPKIREKYRELFRTQIKTSRFDCENPQNYAIISDSSDVTFKPPPTINSLPALEELKTNKYKNKINLKYDNNLNFPVIIDDKK